MLAFAKGCDDQATLRTAVEDGKEIAQVSMASWRMERGQGKVSTSVVDAWFGLMEGLVSIHDRSSGSRQSRGMTLFLRLDPSPLIEPCMGATQFPGSLSRLW